MRKKHQNLAGVMKINNFISDRISIFDRKSAADIASVCEEELDMEVSPSTILSLRKLRIVNGMPVWEEPQNKSVAVTKTVINNLIFRLERLEFEVDRLSQSSNNSIIDSGNGATTLRTPIWMQDGT